MPVVSDPVRMISNQIEGRPLEDEQNSAENLNGIHAFRANGGATPLHAGFARNLFGSVSGIKSSDDIGAEENNACKDRYLTIAAQLESGVSFMPV